VQHLCQCHACAVWAISAWRAGELGVTRKSDHVVVQGIKRKQGDSWPLPRVAKILYVSRLLFILHLKP
jgi:hypothetical protein